MKTETEFSIGDIVYFINDDSKIEMGKVHSISIQAGKDKINNRYMIEGEIDHYGGKFHHRNEDVIGASKEQLMSKILGNKA